MIDDRGTESVDTVYDWLAGGEVIQHVAGADIDFYREDFVQLYHQAAQGLADAVDPDKKFGVKNNGLCFLLAWTIELIQQEVRKIV